MSSFETSQPSSHGDKSGGRLMRTCAGCNQVVDGKKLLTCPTCAKLGRDVSVSTFCSQECFKSNWKTHKSNHDVTAIPMALSAPLNQGIGTNGVRVITHESGELGRVLVSTRSFQPGEIVLEEDPLVVFRVGWPDLLTKYATQLSEDDKVKLLDMQHLSSASEAKYEEFIRSIKQSFDKAITQPVMQELLRMHQVDEQFAFRLCTLVNINGHMYQGPDGPISADDQQLSALFYLGSKATHSCDSNTAYSSKSNRLGKLTYFAIKEIKEGDLITFSYINSPLQITTRERRLQLKRTKDFLCQCSSCLSPDVLTAIKCYKAVGCQGYVMEVAKDTYPLSGPPVEGYIRQCSICGPCESAITDSSSASVTPSPTKSGNGKGKSGNKGKSSSSSTSVSSTERFQQYQDRFHSIQAVAGMEGISPDLCDRLDKLVKDARNSANGIGPCNYLILEMLQTLSTFMETSASIVEEIGASNGGSSGANTKYVLMSRDYRKKSADALFQLTKLLEGIHARCTTCCFSNTNCNQNHPAASGCEQYILSAGMNCLTARVPLPAGDVEKYKLYMILSYGADDTEVKDICKSLQTSVSKK